MLQSTNLQVKVEYTHQVCTVSLAEIKAFKYREHEN
jgi:hypothetical protein